MRPKSLISLLVLLGLVFPASFARADSIVTECTEANLLAALSVGGVVSFACSGTITLTATITISSDTTIDGSGVDVTLSGNGEVPVISVSPGVTLSLNELTISDGFCTSCSGGGIYNNGGTLIVSNSTFSGNSAYFGGGIRNYGGILTLSNSTFSENNATYGGGISNSFGSITVSNSTFSENNATYGGGIDGTGTISDSIFANNHATSDGGAIYGGGTISHSTFSSNSANNGGAIRSYVSDFTVMNCTFIGNTAIHGGAIDNDYGGQKFVSNSTFTSNSATNVGGGITNNNGYITVTNSTFTGNSATNNGGGIQNHGIQGTSLIVSNSTFSGNNATFGGGIYNNGVSNVTVTVKSSTFSGNSATSQGGGIYAIGGWVSLVNTIVANSPAGENCTGIITDLGGNLKDDDSICPGVEAEPLLGPLQDNGGPTQTMALSPGSQAIDAGNNEACAAEPVNNLDQRGLVRPVDGDSNGIADCDIGAFEYTPITTLTNISGYSPNPPIAGQTFTITVNVTSSVGVPTGNVHVWVAGSPAACDALLSDGSGSCQLTISTAGGYTIVADFTGPYYLPSQDLEQQVIAASTTTTITSDIPDPSVAGTPFTVSFTTTSTYGMPPGVVIVTVGSSPNSCITSLLSGTGNCDLTIYAPGIYTLTAEYLGDPFFHSSTDTKQHTVIPPYRSLYLPLLQ